MTLWKYRIQYKLASLTPLFYSEWPLIAPRKAGGDIHAPILCCAEGKVDLSIHTGKVDLSIHTSREKGPSCLDGYF